MIWHEDDAEFEEDGRNAGGNRHGHGGFGGGQCADIQFGRQDDSFVLLPIHGRPDGLLRNLPGDGRVLLLHTANNSVRTDQPLPSIAQSVKGKILPAHGDPVKT